MTQAQHDIKALTVMLVCDCGWLGLPDEAIQAGHSFVLCPECEAKLLEVTPEHNDFTTAANNLLQTKADLWQKMADEGGE